MVDGIITRVAPETSQRIDTTPLASVERKETIKLIRESKAGSDRQEKQAPQGDDAPKTQDAEAGASDHLSKFFELTQEMVKSQEEAFQKQLADMVGEKHGKLHRGIPGALARPHGRSSTLGASGRAGQARRFEGLRSVRALRVLPRAVIYQNL